MMRTLLFLPFAAACSSPDTDARVAANVANGGPEFKVVSEVFLDNCGSLDCHGSKYRNMHLYGFGSERLEGTLPDEPSSTTQAEADRNYESISSVEPEAFRTVIAEGGRAPERLTFYRKALELEAHKGGRPIEPGSNADKCIRSWLASKIDSATCLEAVSIARRPP
jgi:hypothetical protein